jgi:hypothetical protein
MLSPETRMMCDLLSPNFDCSTFNPEILHSCSPEKLLTVLKQHRLYPLFNKIWNKTRADEINNPEWLQFSDMLKKMAIQNQMYMLKKTSALVHLVKLFESEGIELIALKGPALAKQLYDDVSLRYSWDLDIVILPEYIDKAATLLESLYYGDIMHRGIYSPKQKSFCINHFQHFTYLNRETHESIEVHWRLPQLNAYTPISTNQLWDTKRSLEIAGTRIFILDPSLEVAFLAAHGAGHSFYRLSWLYDITNYLNQKKEFIQPLPVNNKALIKLMNTTHAFSNLIFQYPNPIDKPFNKTYIKHCLAIIHNIKEETGKPVIIREYWGKLLLRPNFFVKFRVFGPLFTSPRDWNTLRLPDGLFFLYFLLRPFLLVYRLIKTRLDS